MDRNEPRRDADAEPKGWTFATLLAHVTGTVQDRFDALMGVVVSNDRRYLEQFASADQATRVAMQAAEKAINAAIVAADSGLRNIKDIIDSNDRRYLELFASADKATQIAMVAAEKAINAAMVSAEKAINAAMVAAEKAVQAALAASEKAVAKAEENQIRVNESQNEFRSQLKDQANSLATKENLDALDRRVQLVEKNSVSVASLDSLERRMQTLEKSNVSKEMHDQLVSKISALESSAVTRTTFDDKIGSHERADKSAHEAEDARIAVLEKSASFIAGGPRVEDLARQLKGLQETRANTLGRGAIIAVLWGLAGSAIVGVVVGVAVLLFKFIATK